MKDLRDAQTCDGVEEEKPCKFNKNMPQNGHASTPYLHDLVQWNHNEDEHPSFFWRAHTVTVLFLVIIVLCYVALFEEPVYNPAYNAKRGLMACIAVFLAFGITQARDGPFVRPHPVFWRFILCSSVVYELLMIFILFQNNADARKWMVYFDESLGKPLPEVDYAGNCTFYDPDNKEDPFHNIKSKFDCFVPAHLFGWWAKALILRDFWFTNTVSILFEIYEYSLEHQLANFHECWWDHWIMDAALCNGIGIYLGMKTCEYFQIKEYNWRNLWQIPTYSGKLKRAAEQFTPYRWENFEWEATTSLKRWLATIGITIMFSLAELNCFYMKFVLSIYPEHWMILARLFLFGFAGTVAVKEVYQYMDDPICKRFGQQSWILAAIIITETLISLKFGWETIKQPPPTHISIFWALLSFGVVAYTLIEFQVLCRVFRVASSETCCHSNFERTQFSGTLFFSFTREDKQMSTILQHMKTRKRRYLFQRNAKTKRKTEESDVILMSSCPGGVFEFLPLEVCHYLFSCTTLRALGMLSITSRKLRNMVVTYIYSSQASENIVPKFQNQKRLLTVSQKYHNHYKNLGYFVKRSSCLFSTKERLKKVGQVLDKLRESHIQICNDLGSDLAYSCYGEFLHAFLAGWEFEEKSKAFTAIKGASLLEERIKQVLKSSPGSHPGFERYIRIFCREIFLNKSEQADLSFWLAQILKAWPMCLQAKILFVLYGPMNEDSEELEWDVMSLVTDNHSSPMYSELGQVFKVLLNDTSGFWNADDAVSLFEELTAVPTDWEIENVASLLSQSGERFCCEVLGNKAINGRIRELSYLLYHLWQKVFSVNRKSGIGQFDWFLAVVKHLSNLIKSEKIFHEMLNQMLQFWEEATLDALEDFQYASDSQREEGQDCAEDRLHTLMSLTMTLLRKVARTSG
eukprot:gene18120-19930_t